MLILKRKKIKTIISILLSFISFLSVAETISLNESLKEINIENVISYCLTDSSEQFEKVKTLSFENNFKNISTIKNNQTLWCKFQIKNTSKTELNTVLRCSKYSFVKLFNENGKLLGESGMHFPIQKRNTGLSAVSEINFTSEPHLKSNYYLKLQLINPVPFEYEKVPISLYSSNFLNKVKDNKNNFLFFFLGGIILMMLYNLALFLQVKKLHYLYFVLLNLMILMFVLVQTGQLEYFMAKNYAFHERIILFFGNLNLLSYTLFSDTILNFNKHHPVASRFKQYLIPFLILLNIPISFGYFLPLIFGIGSLLALIVYNFVIYAAFKSVKRGDSSVSFFFAGNLFFYIGTIISVLMINEVLPRTLFGLTSIEFVEIGNLLQLSLFSLSIGSIIKGIEKKLDRTESEKKLALQTAEFKDHFLANMSHEIRTPLNGIIGMLDVFYASYKLNSKQKEQLEIVKSSSHSLLTIINDVLDLSKIQAGKMKVFPKNTNIIESVSSIKSLFQPIAERKGLLIEVFISKDVPKYIVIDESRIKQIINNMVSNAIKFTEKGKIIIRVERRKKQLYISIQDTGCGIKDSLKNKIFEEFTQIDEANAKRIDGTGLGLSICSKLVKLIGGEIGVTSEINVGSTFWFTVNFKIGQKSNNLEKHNVVENKKLKLNILVVEDKPINQKVAQLMLQKIGHQSEIANNGLQCLAKFEEGKYDIILMDVHMPEMNGIEATQTIKKKFNNIPPIIGLSANSMEGDAEKYVKLGFDDYLSKPITIEILESKINAQILLLQKKHSD